MSNGPEESSGVSVGETVGGGVPVEPGVGVGVADGVEEGVGDGDGEGEGDGVGDGVGVGVADGVGEGVGLGDGMMIESGIDGARGFGSVRYGMKFNVPKLVAFLWSQIVWLIAWMLVVPHQLLIASILSDSVK